MVACATSGLTGLLIILEALRRLLSEGKISDALYAELRRLALKRAKLPVLPIDKEIRSANMSNFKFSDLTKDEMMHLTTSLIKSKLINEVIKDELAEVKFDADAVQKLLNNPSKIVLKADTGMAKIVGKTLKVDTEERERDIKEDKRRLFK